MTTEEQFLELVRENRQKLCGVCRYYAALCDAVCEEDLFQEIVLNLAGKEVWNSQITIAFGGGGMRQGQFS